MSALYPLRYRGARTAPYTKWITCPVLLTVDHFLLHVKEGIFGKSVPQMHNCAAWRMHSFSSWTLVPPETSTLGCPYFLHMSYHVS